MRTIVHIGQHKTGSTALQSVLVADRVRLADHGILYPEAGHVRRRHRLEPNHNGLFLLLNDRPVPGPSETLAEVGERIGAQIAQHRPQVVLISAERGFRTPDRLGAVALDRLDRMIPGPKQTVAYLRRPDRFASSYHRQRIRQGMAEAAPLHLPEGLDDLTKTSLLDYLRTVRLYEDIFGPVVLFDYEVIDDTIGHFYRNVLDLEPPRIEPVRTNPSLPQVVSNLALEHLHRHGELTDPAVRSLFAHGEREPVDLLGPQNRRRLLEWFTPQDIELGRRAGRERFFADLDAMVEVPDHWLTVAEADRRYREIFDALVAPVDARVLRKACLLFESTGEHETAGRIFAALGAELAGVDRTWFRDDVAAASKGTWTIDKGRYVRTADADTADAGPAGRRVAPSLAARVGRRLRRAATTARNRVAARPGRR